MLEAIIASLRPCFEAAAAIGAAAASERKDENLKMNRLLKYSALIGVVIAVTLGAISASVILSGAVEREYFDGIVNSLALAGTFLLILLIWLKIGGVLIRSAVLTASITVIVLPRATQIIIATNKTLSMEGAISSKSLSDIVGLSIGLLISVLFGLFISKGSKKINSKGLAISSTAMIGILFVQQAVSVIQFGFTYSLIPLDPFVLSVFAPLINSYDRFFYALLAAGFMYPVAYFIFADKEVLAESANPAQIRKYKASIKRQKRIFGSTTIVLLIAFSLVTGQSILKNYAKRATELSPAVEVKAVKDTVKIIVKDVNDKELHRFAYTTGDGVRIRFIVVYKGSDIYGAGFDFCDICGPAGYFQRGNDVVCKRCDVVINIPTIGFPGGCNPIPLKYKVTGKRLSISVKDIEKVKQKFR